MRVLAFADHMSAASSGGAERVAGEVYRRLGARDDVDLTVVTVVRAGQEPVRLPGTDVRAVRGRDLSRVLRVELLAAPGLAAAARRLHDAVRPDVLHANGLHFHGSVVAARLARRRGTPLVSTAHLGDLAALGPLVRLAGTAWDQTLGRLVVQTSDRVVAVSHAVAEHVRTLGARSGSTVVAPNGVDHDVFHTVGRRPPGGPGPLHAVLVGRLIGTKGPEVATAAVARARRAGADVRLTVVGDGPLRDQLREQVAALGIADRVRFAGHVADPAGVAAHLRAADVLLRPSYTEGLPLAVLEAMACGVPVVCSTVPGTVEVVEDRVSGWHTRPGDVDGTAAALRALDDDRALLRRLGAAAAATAATHTWTRSAEIHHTVLQTASHTASLTAHHRAPRTAPPTRTPEVQLS